MLAFSIHQAFCRATRPSAMWRGSGLSPPGAERDRLCEMTGDTPQRGAFLKILHVAVLLLVVFGGGCSTESKSKLNAETLQNVAATQEQLRLRVRALVGPMRSSPARMIAPCSGRR